MWMADMTEKEIWVSGHVRCVRRFPTVKPTSTPCTLPSPHCADDARR